MVKSCLGDRTLEGLFHAAVYSGVVSVTYTCGLLSCQHIPPGPDSVHCGVMMQYM